MTHGFSPHGANFFGPDQGKYRGALGLRFLLPPFTVLNAREGWWQNRKRAWLDLGIKSELGRGENLIERSSSELAMMAGKYPRMTNVAAPGGPPRPAMSQKGRKPGDPILRGDSYGRPVLGTEPKRFAIKGTEVKKPDALLFSTKAQNRLNEIMRQNKPVPAGLTGEIENYDGAERGIIGTSIFDPVLCELAYRWFSPPAGVVLDPFAGGSVRGIVASKLGRRYIGVDLSATQCAANRGQAKELCTGADPLPSWIVGDSRDTKTLVAEKADFIFTCPPYADLECYSDNPKDLSVLGYADFIEAYAKIIAAACAKLRPDRFACIVVGDVRGKDGCYYGFPWHTIEAFAIAGLRLYNEAVLVTAVGSLPIRARRQFDAGRKMGKTHQNVFVFVKGDPRKAAEACRGVTSEEEEEEEE